ncbi:MAG: acetoacetate decarboxylase [Gaiellaceae bacterium]
MTAGGRDEKRERDAESAFSMPWDAPLVPAFPFSFRDVSILTLCWRTDEAAIARVLPAPLEPIGDVVVAHVYRMPDTDFVGEAHECNVMVGARYSGGDEIVEGGYSVGLYLDSDVGVAHGREVHGQPKKLASLRLETRGDLIVAEVERNGITILTGALPYKQQVAAPEEMRRHFDFRNNINYKVIPHVDGSPAIRQLTSRRLAELEVSECWVGPCTVELRPNPQAPVWRLPVVEPLEGFFWRTNFTLVGGTVLHDYLQEAVE